MNLKLVHLIVLKNKKVLLLKRQNTGIFDGFFSLPGGKWESHETMEEAAVREAREELGISTDPQYIKLLYHSVVPSPTEPHINYLNYFLEISAYMGRVHIAEPSKCAELKFYKYSELPSNMIPFARKGLDKALKSKLSLAPAL